MSATEEFKIDLRQGAILERGCRPLCRFRCSNPIRLKSDVAAFANPKSSTGRLDILTRLISDQATVFDQVEEGYEGRLYLEVAPRSFSVVARTGTRLNQLRFRRTRGELPRPITAADWKNLINNGEVADAQAGGDKTGMLPFSIDPARRGAWGADRLYSARRNAHPAHRSGAARLLSRWTSGSRRPLPPAVPRSSLDPDEFYILMTKEAIAVPPDFAAAMLPYDTRAGEFRVHFARASLDQELRLGQPPPTKAGSNAAACFSRMRSHEVPFVPGRQRIRPSAIGCATSAWPSDRTHSTARISPRTTRVRS